MLVKLKNIIAKGVWQSLALVIVFFIAGPEIMLGLEMMAMVEFLGASTFVLVYTSGIKLFIFKLINKFKRFERYYMLFLPPLSVLKKMPSIVIHAIPERTLVLLFLGSLVTVMLLNYRLFI
tara:strand:+ start:2353 stop:2715 length:363 start_codon:yes stop_codon:yes gene_type:complete